MHNIFEKLTADTPLIRLPCDTATLLAKAEWYNPAGSVKDRVALAMLQDAQLRGLLKPGGTVIEATSGNTGIALAALSAQLGCRCIIVMPENMSRERILRMRAYGARVELSPAADGMSGAVRLAKELADTIPGSFWTDQFSNEANPAAHFTSTGPEIWQQTAGHVDIFVAGVGTGGTITGVGRYLKQHNPSIRVIAVEPADEQRIPGIGPGFMPAILDQQVIDESIRVTTSEAVTAARQLAAGCGLLVGISAGAAVHAAHILAKRQENLGKNIVTVLPDSGERYLSTGVFG